MENPIYKTRLGIGAALVATIAVILFLYFFADHTPPVETRFDTMMAGADTTLSAPQLEELRLLSKEASQRFSHPVKKADALIILADKWEEVGYAPVAAEFYRQAADISGVRYGEAGDRFFDLFRKEEDPDLRVDYVYRAIYCFEKATELDSTDLDRKIKLADCYTEGTGNMMMQGVFLLRDIAEQHPEDAAANLRLARFSLMSNQFDKAVGRAKSVLEKDSLNLQARYLLAESYMGMGFKDSTIQVLEEGLSLFSDSSILRDLRIGIKQLSAN